MFNAFVIVSRCVRQRSQQNIFVYVCESMRTNLLRYESNFTSSPNSNINLSSTDVHAVLGCECAHALCEVWLLKNRDISLFVVVTDLFENFLQQHYSKEFTEKCCLWFHYNFRHKTAFAIKTLWSGLWCNLRR